MTIISALLLFLGIVNIYCFFLFWLDKRRAVTRGWRIPEEKLLGYALMGGSLGALLAQQVFRHKSTKEPFRRRLIRIALVHVVLAVIFLSPPLWTVAFDVIEQGFSSLRALQ